MTRSELFELWRTRVDECGGVRPALRKYDGIRRSTLQELLRWGQDHERGYEIPDGFVMKGESVLVDANGQVQAKWIKTREDYDQKHLVEALHETFLAYDGKAALIPPPEQSDADLLTVYPLPDLHIGMLAWGKETGQDYDLQAALQLAEQTVGDLVSQSRSSKRAVILGLGDYFHTNDHKAVTPQSGHRLDVDGRWQKIFAAGAHLATRIVNLAAQKHEEVEVVFLPGNHDLDAAACLTVALSLFYSATPRITVRQDPGIAWYYRFGQCLLGATHGHTMKADRAAMMLATDRPKDWGETLFRHLFMGHIHHETARSVGPVRVESFTTPAARDAYAANSGYRSERAMSALTFHTLRGEIGRHRVNIVH